MNIKIQMHEDMVIKYPTSDNTMYSQVAFDYRSNLLAWGCIPVRKQPILEVELINNVKLDLTDFAFIMSSPSGEIYNFRPYIKMLTTDLYKEVPEFLPNRTKQVNTGTEEEPVYIELVKTWEEWVKPNYTKTEIEGYIYFLSNSGTDKGEALLGSQLWDIEMLDYAEIVIDLPVIEEVI